MVRPTLAQRDKVLCVVSVTSIAIMVVCCGLRVVGCVYGVSMDPLDRVVKGCWWIEVRVVGGLLVGCGCGFCVDLEVSGTGVLVFGGIGDLY